MNFESTDKVGYKVLFSQVDEIVWKAKILGVFRV